MVYLWQSTEKSLRIGSKELTKGKVGRFEQVFAEGKCSKSNEISDLLDQTWQLPVLDIALILSQFMMTLFFVIISSRYFISDKKNSPRWPAAYRTVNRPSGARIQKWCCSGFCCFVYRKMVGYLSPSFPHDLISHNSSHIEIWNVNHRKDLVYSKTGITIGH